MAVQLSAEAIERICKGEKVTNPVLQVTEIRRVITSNQNAGIERYRMLVSDGNFVQQGMLATQRNDLVHSGKLQKGSIIKLDNFTCNSVQGRPIIVVIDLEVVCEMCDPIGQPTRYIPNDGVRPVQDQYSADQARTIPGNPQSGNVQSSSIASAVDPSSALGSSYQHRNSDRVPEVPSYGSNANTGRFGNVQSSSIASAADPSSALGSSYQHRNSESVPEVPSYGSNANTGRFGNVQSSSIASAADPSSALGSSYQHRNSESVPEVPSYGSNANTGRFGNVQSSSIASAADPSSALGSSYQHRNSERVPEVPSYGSNANTGRFGSGNSGGSATANTRHHQPANRLPPPAMYMNRGPTARNEAPQRITPVAQLNLYQSGWTIKARVTAKGEMRCFSNHRGDGKVFSFDLLDPDGGEIRATCFNAVVDQFYNQIEVGRVYLISKGNLKPARKEYNHLPNDYEIGLDATSVIKPCVDDDTSIPRQLFHFRPISDLEGLQNNKILDIIGVVFSVSPISTIMRKNNTEVQKRSLLLKDQSGKSVELVLWGIFCSTEGQELQNMCDSGIFPVLVVKSARVNDFLGKAIGTISTSQLFIEPDCPEARTLKEWFDREGRNTPCVSISRDSSTFSRTEVRKFISQIKDEKLGTSEKPDYITVCANISFIKVDNFCYTACPLSVGDRKCSKKVTNNGDGKWRCDKCDKVVDECEYRYILQCQIQDHTGMTWVTAFQEWGEDIMGIPAKELYYMKYEEQDDAKFSEIIASVLFTKFLFKLKVKEETFSDEQRVKSTVVKAERVNFSTEIKLFTDFLAKPNPQGSAGAPQYSATMGNTSKGVGMRASCSSCGDAGHSSANCPSVMSGPMHTTGGYVGRTPPGPLTGGLSSVPVAYGVQKQHLGGY